MFKSLRPQKVQCASGFIVQMPGRRTVDYREREPLGEPSVAGLEVSLMDLTRGAWRTRGRVGPDDGQSCGNSCPGHRKAAIRA